MTLENKFTPEQERAFWNARANDWNIHSEIDEEYLGFVQSALLPLLISVPKGGAILDIAAGANNAAYYPVGFNMGDVTAMDFSRKMLALNPSGHKILRNADEKFPFPDNAYDRVISVFGMRYFQNPESILKECIRVVERGKWVAIVDFDTAYIPLEKHKFNAGEMAKFIMHLGHHAEYEELNNPVDHDPRLQLLVVRKLF